MNRSRRAPDTDTTTTTSRTKTRTHSNGITVAVTGYSNVFSAQTCPLRRSAAYRALKIVAICKAKDNKRSRRVAWGAEVANCRDFHCCQPLTRFRNRTQQPSNAAYE
ncbi:uncharacterized protein Dvir_GJ25812, isoform A [Drosophila virilis]|uniref:Uncharacterized protein, isoform A n=1 Tax=Drosophila virilis TaxID=7244 RepID=A0A0Q9WX38_DROVI|nr:uncharacterized protein Dvir_GJ25812, isoform A [Drosophila virilis]